MAEAPIRGQLLLLSSKAESLGPYITAARKLAVEFVLGVEAAPVVPSRLATSRGNSQTAQKTDAGDASPALRLRFAQRESALEIVQYAMEHPLAAIVAADEYCAPSCSRAASMIGLPGNPPKAADACLDQFSLRQKLGNAGLRTPVLGEPPDGRDLLIAAILDGGKLRVLGAVEGTEATTGIPQNALEAVWRGARAVSLSYGPVYAHLRLAADQVWVLDLAPAIPPCLNDVLHFRIPLVDDDVPLVEVILRHALGMDVSRVYRK